MSTSHCWQNTSCLISFMSLIRWCRVALSARELLVSLYSKQASWWIVYSWFPWEFSPPAIESFLNLMLLVRDLLFLVKNMIYYIAYLRKIIVGLLATFGLLMAIIFCMEPYYWQQIMQNTEFRLVHTIREVSYFEDSEVINISGDSVTLPVHNKILKSLFIPSDLLHSVLAITSTSHDNANIMIFNYLPHFNSVFSPPKYLRVDKLSLSSTQCLILHNHNTINDNKYNSDCKIVSTSQWLLTEQSSWVILLYQWDSEALLTLTKVLHR